MNCRKITFLFVVMLLVGSISQAHAKGTLGKNYISIGADIIKPGSQIVKQFESSITEVKVKYNTPVNQNIDFNFDLAHTSFDSERSSIRVEVEKLSIDTGITYHFAPGQQINPFIMGNLSYIKTEVTGQHSGTATVSIYYGGYGWFSETYQYDTRVDVDDNDFGATIAGGAEIDLGEKAAFTPAISFHKIGDYDDVNVSADITIWLTETVIWKVGVGYAFDAEDSSYGTSLALSF